MKVFPVAEVVRLRTSRDKPPKSHDFGYERIPVVAMKIPVVAGLPTEPLHSDRRSPHKQGDLRSIRRSGWLDQETGHNSHSENVTSENIVRRRLLFGRFSVEMLQHGL